MLDKLIEILKDPITHTQLQLMTDEELSLLNRQIKSGTIYYFDGSTVLNNYSLALISKCKSWIYGIYDNIPLLLPSLAMTSDKSLVQFQKLPKESKIIQTFYNDIGWQKNAAGNYIDAELFEDLRPVMKEYLHKCHLRLGQYIPEKGNFLLDIASGSIQYEEYLTYSKSYNYRICADISLKALQEAKKRLAGQLGFFVLCDITCLPFRNESFDTFVSLHTLYHVAANQQLQAIEELNRVLKVGQKGVIVYSWGEHSFLTTIFQPSTWIKNIRNYFITKYSNYQNALPFKDSTFFFHAHSPKWFKTNVNRKFKVKYVPWRSIDTLVARRFVKPYLGGYHIIRLLFFLENRFPSFFSRYGQYPTLIFEK